MKKYTKLFSLHLFEVTCNNVHLLYKFFSFKYICKENNLVYIFLVIFPESHYFCISVYHNSSSNPESSRLLTLFSCFILLFCFIYFCSFFLFCYILFCCILLYLKKKKKILLCGFPLSLKQRNSSMG